MSLISNPAFLGCVRTAALGSGQQALQYVHRYLMNEGSGSVIHDTVGGVDGAVVNGTPVWASGLLSFADSFYVNIGTGASGVSHGVSFWIKTTAATFGAYSWLDSVGGALVLEYVGGWGTSWGGIDSIGFSNGAWHNIVLIAGHDSGLSLWIDGSMRCGTSSGVLNTPSSTRIGCASTSNRKFTGNIRDFCIYNRAPTPSEIAAIRAAG